MLIARSALRICYFGGSADYHSYFSRYAPVLMIGMSINKYCYVSISRLPQLANCNYQIVCSLFQKTNNIENIKNNGIKGTLKFLKNKYPQLEKISIYISNPDISPKCGTGSSSSMISSLLNCIHNLYGNKPTKNQLATEAILCERSSQFCGESGGIGDQIFVNYPGLNTVTINNDGSFAVRPLEISEQFLNYFIKSHLLFYISDKNGFTVAKSHDNVDADKFKTRIRDIAFEAKKCFQKENIEALGDLLEKSWQEKKQISNLISNQYIDDIHDKAIQAGGFGGKILGSGGTGILLILADPSKHQKIINKINLPIIPININWDNSKIIYNNET